jgi:SpoIID/LytB domain protein
MNRAMNLLGAKLMGAKVKMPIEIPVKMSINMSSVTRSVTCWSQLKTVRGALTGAVVASTLMTSTALGIMSMSSVLLLGRGSAIAPQPAQAQSVSANPEIKVGIVQRFGEKKDDKITLAPLAGDQITVTFKTEGQTQTIATNQLQIEIAMQPLAQPMLQEWVVLSTHRSFESAEDSARLWSAAGIEAEIAQPDAWQVWAKRDIYNEPVVRRLLLENLHAAGYTNAFIDSRVIKEIPKTTFTANGFKYSRDAFNISTGNRRLQMARGSNAGANVRYSDLFAGDMKIQPNAYGTYTLVNQVPVDLYLRGVVPHEIGAGAPQTAIQAQAILARTYALRNLRRFAIDNYEICADTQCQVYFGLAQTDPVSDRAIAATSGQVLTYDNELVDALYSSTTGGITARFTDVWNGEERPYLQPVIDSLQVRWDLEARPLSDEANFRDFIALTSGFNEDGWPAFRWNRQASLKEIGDTLREYLSKRQHPLANFTQVTGLTVVERAPSGRVQKLRVDTDLGSLELLKDESVKALVPPSSLLFYVEPVMSVPPAAKSVQSGIQNGGQSNVQNDIQRDAQGNIPMPGAEANKLTINKGVPAIAPDNSKQTPAPQPVLTGYRFIGGGFGHGVGMSQAGAYNLAKQGYSSEQILEFYFPGTELQPISEATVFYDAESE